MSIQKPIISLSAALLIFLSGCNESNQPFKASNASPADRAEWEYLITQDPQTGLVPVSRADELRFAEMLPSIAEAPDRSGDYDWQAMGPFNFGGRTRGAAFDVRNEDIIIGGSVSGGIFKSINGGQSWTRTSSGEQACGITCLTQDQRSGKEDNWYAGSGEGYNSASANGARFIGNGILKSTDNGDSWTALESTQNDSPQALQAWDRIWRVKTDPTATEDVVFAAITGAIMRSADGGESWTQVLSSGGSTSYYSDIEVSESGVFYATLSGDGQNSGLFRSTDGVNWTNITPTVWPGAYNRIVLGINPSDEDQVYFMAETPGNGKQTFDFRGSPEWVSLWRYEYISGDGTGAGGFWDNLSENLPRGPYRFDDLNLQGGYNMLVTVSPSDPNLVIIGGTNLFRSTSGFSDSTSTTFIGGYGETTDLPDFQLYLDHHPDQHLVFFSDDDPDVMYSCNDGGIMKTTDVTATPVVWESLNNEYNTTQFYTVAVDRNSNGSQEIMGGLQDNGTFYNNSDDPFNWTFPWSYDGAYTAIADGGSMHLTSIQLGRMFKLEIDESGNRTAYKRFDPIGGDGYYFIHPWAMDPVKSNIVYLPLQNRLWRNDEVDQIPIDNGADSISQGWTQLPFNLSGNGSSVGVSTSNPSHRVYVGTSQGNIYRIDNADQTIPAFTDLSSNLDGQGFLNCIAVDPLDGDHAMAVYSNYNVHSIFYTEDGGETWFRAGGNLEAESAPEGAPADLYNLSNAPSVRWARIINTEGGKLYLVGTSVGLFASRKLEPGVDRESDATIWYQLAKEELGNTVTMMIDHRESDGFVAVATHGSGIFTTHVKNNWVFSGLDESSNNSISIYPNPAIDDLTISSSSGIKQIIVYDSKGARVIEQEFTNRVNYTLNVSNLKSGSYFILINDDPKQLKKFIIL